MKAFRYTILIQLFVLVIVFPAIAQNQLGLSLLGKPTPQGSVVGAKVNYLVNMLEFGQGNALFFGAEYDFRFETEDYFDGVSGAVYGNGVHFLFGSDFPLLENRKLHLQPYLFAGLTHKKLVGDVTRPDLIIYQQFGSQFSYISRGIGFNVQYDLKENWRINAVIKSDFYRLTNMDGVLEMPETILGLGFVYLLN